MIIPALHAEIIPTAPFAFDLALEYLRVSPSAVIEQVDGATYRRAVRLNGRMMGLSVSSCGDVDMPRLRVAVVGEDAGPEDLRAATSLVRATFATDDDLAGLFQSAAADPVFDRLVQRVRGLRPVLIPDAFEALVWAIIGQQINITFAARLKRVLVERFGSTFTADGVTLPVFPSPERLSMLDHELDLLPI